MEHQRPDHVRTYPRVLKAWHGPDQKPDPTRITSGTRPDFYVCPHVFHPCTERFILGVGVAFERGRNGGPGAGRDPGEGVNGEAAPLPKK